MVGIVVVSHSAQLAEAAVSLALEMVAADPPRIVLAAGTADGGFGTDAVRVSKAIIEADDGGGVVVLTDLGSAVLSAEMALEFLPDADAPVRIVPAPFVEGLLAAAVRAAGGADLNEVASEASGALRGKIEQLGGADDIAPRSAGVAASTIAEAGVAPVRAELPTGVPAASPTPLFEPLGGQIVHRDVRIVNAAGLHARPAGQFAAAAARFDADVTVTRLGRAPVAAVSALSLAALGTRAGDTVTLAATGPDAGAAVAALAGLIESGFGEGVEGSDGSPEGLGKENSAEAIGVSVGRVVGPVRRMPDPLPAPDLSEHLHPAERESAIARVSEGFARVTAEYQARASRASGTVADVLGATAQLAADPVLVERAGAAVRDHGLPPAAAVWEVLDAIAADFRSAGGLQAERVTDIRDIRDRVFASLIGAQLPGIPESDEPFVLVARDLAPADTAELDPQRILGIVSSDGGPTSHTAILARSLGIPAVVAAPLARELRDGDTVLVDGRTGEVVRDPSPEAAKTASLTPIASSEPKPLVGPVHTSDGTQIAVLANVGGPQDVPEAVRLGAAGVGLFRTEFCFLGRDTAPTRAEQVAAYTAVLDGFRGGHVVIRTLDAGSDKPLPFLEPAAEDNPALGVRGYRTAKLHPEILRTQLAAIAEAAAAVPDAETWVMAPMIATVPEAQAFAKLARGAGLQHIGVMVETPSAALMSAELFEFLDFVSLGTNDLAQYTMAADRLSGELAELGDPWQPAVLRLIAQCVAGAGGRSVGVCGEAAADPALARVLVGLGVTSLSMTPRALTAVGESIAAVSFEACQAAAEAALGARNSHDARRAAAGVFGA